MTMQRSEVVHETPQLELRRLGIDDADFYFDMFDANREHIRAFDPLLAQKGFPTIDSVAFQLSPQLEKTNQHYAVLQDGEFVGATALYSRDYQQKEIAYWVDQHHLRQGIASEACRLLINEAIIYQGARRFDALIAPENQASVRTISRFGFTFAEVIRDEKGIESHLYSWDTREPEE